MKHCCRIILLVAMSLFVIGCSNLINPPQDDSLQLQSNGSITGIVATSNDDSPLDATVAIPGTSMIATTNEAGEFALSNVPPGTYEAVRVTKSGYYAGIISDIEVVESEATDLGSVTLILSTGATAAVLINQGVALTTSATVELTIGSSDNAYLMMVSERETFSGASWMPLQPSIDFTFEDSSNGDKTVWVKLANSNGLESSGFSDSILLSSEPTTVTLQEPTADGSIATQQVAFDWSDVPDAPSVPDEVYDIQVASDENFETIVSEATDLASSSYSHSFATDGTYYWRVRARIPSISEQGVWYDRTFHVDTTAPDAPVLEGVLAGTYTSFQSFVLSDTETGANVEYSLDGGTTWLAYSGEVQLDSDGVYTITVRQSDEAGNVSSESPPLEVKIDTTAPAEVTDLTTNPDNGEVVLSWTNPEDIDFDHVVVYYGQTEANTEFTGTLDPSGTSITGLTNDTEYTFLIQTVDTNGNVSSGATATVWVGAFTYQVSWDQQLDAETYAAGYASLVDYNGTVAVEMSGAMQLNAASSSLLSTSENHFGSSVNSYQFIHDGNDWGGIFAKINDGFDISALHSVRVAIKGTIPESVKHVQVYAEDTTGTAAQLNLLDYSGVTRDGWILYDIPLSDFIGVDFAQWAAIGIWNPYTNAEGNTAAGSYVAVDWFIDIAFN